MRTLLLLCCLALSGKSLAWTVKDNVTELPRELFIANELKKSPKKPEEKPAPKPVFTDATFPKIESFEEEPKKKKKSASFQKTAASYNLEEQAAVDYRVALDWLKKGNTLQAEKTLVNTLNMLPNHSNSRAELVNLYIKHNRDFEAQQLLMEGLKQDEENPEFLKLMAILMERRDEPEAALDLLSKIPQEHKNEKKVVVLLGQLYQQTGRYELAKQQYDRLLQIEPSNPVWILGKSIALEAEGKRKEALEGYQLIQRIDGVNPRILDYVDNRVSVLKG